MASVPLAQDEPRERITLTDFESSAALGIQRGVTTTTFLRGRAGPATVYLRERLRAIARENPWIVGRVVRERSERNLRFDFPSAVDGKPFLIDDSTLDELVRLDPPGLIIHSKMPYTELRNAITTSKAQLPARNGQFNNEDLVFRVTVVSDSIDSQGSFAIIFSMSHAIGDGHTYYAILNMLSEGSPISALNPKRKPEVEVLCKEATKDEAAYVPSLAIVLSYIQNAFFRAKTKCCAYYVDTSKVDTSKAAAISRGADFVSTNDVLVSTFSRIVNSRLCFMAINLRNRVEGATDTDAGNYQRVLGMDAGVYRYPEGIRRVLKEGPSFVAHKKQYPGIFEAVSSNISLTTSWAHFGSDLVLPGCEHILQVPIAYSVFDCAVIFAPRSDKLAVLYFLRSTDRKRLCEIAPLGASVSDALFGDR